MDEWRSCFDGARVVDRVASRPGEFVIPSLLGGADSLMIGRVLYDEFFTNRDWPLASAVATVLLLILVLPMMLFQRSQVREADLS